MPRRAPRPLSIPSGLRTRAITAVGLGLASPLLEGVAIRAPRRKAGSTTASDKLVVALNLFGGNDGLNTVIPLSQYDTYPNSTLGDSHAWRPD